MKFVAMTFILIKSSFRDSFSVKLFSFYSVLDLGAYKEETAELDQILSNTG